MQYEAVSRALAYVSCLSTMSLFATSMAIAAVNVGGLRSPDRCPASACTAHVISPAGDPFGGLNSKGHVEAVAAALWSTKI
jgi:hypothetical protein